jgi:hypothetical protein
MLGATIGVLIGDGTTVTFTGPLNNFLLCLQLRNLQSIDSDFTVYDFAVANLSFTSFTPLEIATSFQVTILRSFKLPLQPQFQTDSLLVLL